MQAPILGINSHLLRDEDLRLLRKLGIRHLRSTLYEPLWRENASYPITMRETAARCADQGMSLLYVVHNAWGEVVHRGHDQQELRRFTASLLDMVRTMPKVEAWQLWNEQDVWVQAPFGAGMTERYTPEQVGVNYARWWADVAPRIRDLRPEALLVTGANAYHAAGRWRGFFRGMVETGIDADAIGVHAYGEWEESRRLVAEARQIVAGAAPLWLTETGAQPGGHWSPEYHARAWRSIVEGNEQERLAERLYFYALETDPNDPWHGVREPDGSERPVLRWLRERRR